MKQIDRRSILKGVGTAGIAGFAGCSSSSGGDNEPNADSSGGKADGSKNETETPSPYPEERITLVIPYGTAGGYNAYTRLVGPYLGEALNAPGVNYENIVGAGGRIATRNVSRSDPDGYRMMIMNADNMAIQTVIYDLEFDIRNLTYFPQVTEEGTLWGISPELDISSWDDWVEAMKAGDLRLGAESPTSSGVMAPLFAGKLSGRYDPQTVIDSFVQYPTKNEMVAGIRRGNINVMASAYSSVLPFVESGDLKPFFVTEAGDTPPDPTPNALTLGTEGVKNAEQIESAVKTVRVFTGPPEIPENRTKKIRKGFMTAFENKELQQKAADINRPIRPTSGEEAKKATVQKIEANKEIKDLLKRLAGE